MNNTADRRIKVGLTDDNAALLDRIIQAIRVRHGLTKREAQNYAFNRVLREAYLAPTAPTDGDGIVLEYENGTAITFDPAAGLCSLRTSQGKVLETMDRARSVEVVIDGDLLIGGYETGPCWPTWLRWLATAQTPQHG